MTVYIQQGFKSNKLNIRNIKSDLITVLETAEVQIVPNDHDIKEYKSTEALYFISGDIKQNEDGHYIRSNNNMLYRDYAVLDIEDTGLSNNELLSIFNNKLSIYNYAYYPSISHTEDNPRYRVIVELDRNANKDEYTLVISELYALLNVNGDTSAKTFSQLQGLPICTASDSANYKVTAVRGGKGYPVSQIEKTENNSTKFIDNDNSNIVLDDNDFIDLFFMYLEVDKNNLETDYNNSLSVIISLAKSVLCNQISYEASLEAAELLAYDNQDYRVNNLNKLNAEIKNGIDKIRTNYDIISRMKATGYRELQYEINWKLGHMPKSDRELYYRLNALGKQWRQANEKINEKTGEVTQPVMGFTFIADFIRRNCHIVLIGENRDIAALYIYSYSNGVYELSESKIKQLVNILEFRYDLTKIKRIVEILRVKAKYVERLENRYLIAVNNGIFNLKTKKLEKLSPDYIITSKIDTNYNINAINDYINNYKNTFDVDNWIKSIADNDEEIELLLWQVINESINPNHTRRKLGVMLGSGKNGKGTFQALLSNLIGMNMIATLKPPQFATQFQISQLIGKVCNIGDDISNRRLDEIDVIKSIVSGDPITIDRKNKEPITVSLKTFLLFSANEMPKTAEKSQAFLDRLLIIPFNADFQGQNEDRSIKDTHIKNKYVLEYVLYKALHLEFEHFIEPQAVKDALKLYAIDNDSVMAYILEEYIPNGYHLIKRMPVVCMTQSYNDYCRDNNLIPRQRIGRAAFGFIKNYSKDNKLPFDYDYLKQKLTPDNKYELESAGFWIDKWEKNSIVVIEKNDK
ncbi:DNA primase [Gemella sp. GH3]|uniref:DNA primase family protein n=1 Tax=unclassified Gemella TaxID=2624949 RepID=UPI0015CFCCB2|nr:MULTISPECIES: phage/plasmid primase, P4 family [unclassified Gemella]MBF0713542.1 DNA primase [Gemella sp. GH3.1]NYS50494.1 DNA primase [Gemella sp. GH3]